MMDAMLGIFSKKINELVDAKLIAISPNAKLGAAIRLFKGSNVDTIPVVDHGTLVGILNEEDVLWHQMEDKNSDNHAVAKVMKKPVFVAANAPIKEAIRVVTQNQLTRLPVVDSKQSMRCIGIVTATELLTETSSKKRK